MASSPIESLVGEIFFSYEIRMEGEMRMIRSAQTKNEKAMSMVVSIWGQHPIVIFQIALYERVCTILTIVSRVHFVSGVLD